MSVITIDRLAGTRDREVAGAVAERLGYRLLDEEINELVHARLGRPRPATWDERLPSFFTTWMYAFASATAGEFVGSAARLAGPAADYVSATQECVREAASGGRVVIVGRGASVLSAGGAGCLRVFLTGEEQRRVQILAEQRRVGLDVARTELRRLDGARRHYSSRLYSRRLEDPGQYDMLIDSAASSVERAAGAICAAAAARFGLVQPALAG